MNFRKINHIIHRDLGYLFFAMCIIYGLSGIAFNHINDWNPNYIVTNDTVKMIPFSGHNPSEADINDFLAQIHEEGNYKKHIIQPSGLIKVFIQDGTIIMDVNNQLAIVEKIKRRPVFYQFNYLHYNNVRHLWTIYSDFFATGLIILATSGLFMLKGKNGITGRGALITALGIAAPIILFLYYTHK